eukprot:TRINITY_DN9295_c0_g1_i1.p1 TRINITY_DN9295_c0_g1~~TRINITY_DN9295_c0_g1_i1.p1  ORF type:complete len:122 (-),score=28.88 TRINITY_DN9295_c0_g1_i1:117-482(-)
MGEPMSQTEARNAYQTLYARYFPKRGPSGNVMFLAGFVISGVGLYIALKGNRKMDFYREEEKRMQLALVPLLQAETDRKFVRRQKELYKWEAEVMKDVPGWVVGEPVYHTRWMPPRPKMPY